MLEGTKARVRVNGKYGRLFQLLRGLKQGSVLSPCLYGVYGGAMLGEVRRRLDGMGIALQIRVGGEVFGEKELAEYTDLVILELLFADDAEILANSAEELQMILNVFVEVAKQYAMEVSIKKTVILVVKPKGVEVDRTPVLWVEGRVLRVVNEFMYLGSVEEEEAGMGKEVAHRIQRMMASYNALRGFV